MNRSVVKLTESTRIFASAWFVLNYATPFHFKKYWGVGGY